MEDLGTIKTFPIGFTGEKVLVGGNPQHVNVTIAVKSAEMQKAI